MNTVFHLAPLIICRFRRRCLFNRTNERQDFERNVGKHFKHMHPRPRGPETDSVKRNILQNRYNRCATVSSTISTRRRVRIGTVVIYLSTGLSTFASCARLTFGDVGRLTRRGLVAYHSVRGAASGRGSIRMSTNQTTGAVVMASGR